ncbi:hypothetical protein B0H13DRAFT_1922683 [Mycena leptocephala]|nr:hypothetical protein B0H13DRAFT_1922683 [Mycena leptocephala]
MPTANAVAEATHAPPFCLFQLLRAPPKRKIKAKKKGNEARLDAHNDTQLRTVSNRALCIEVHYVQIAGDEDKKKPGNETRDKTGQRIVRDEPAQGGAACNDLEGRSD